MHLLISLTEHLTGWLLMFLLILVHKFSSLLLCLDLFFSILGNISGMVYEFPNGYNNTFGVERFRICEGLFDPSNVKVSISYIRVTILNNCFKGLLHSSVPVTWVLDIQRKWLNVQTNLCEGKSFFIGLVFKKYSKSYVSVKGFLLLGEDHRENLINGYKAGKWGFLDLRQEIMKLHDKTANKAVVYWVTQFHTFLDLLVSIKSYKKSLFFVKSWVERYISWRINKNSIPLCDPFCVFECNILFIRVLKAVPPLVSRK